MNNWYIAYLAESRRRNDEIGEAEKYRMARSGATLRARPGKFTILLAYLGKLLEEWGCRLQQRYGTPITISDIVNAQKSNPCAH